MQNLLPLMVLIAGGHKGNSPGAYKLYTLAPRVERRKNLFGGSGYLLFKYIMKRIGGRPIPGLTIQTRDNNLKVYN